MSRTYKDKYAESWWIKSTTWEERYMYFHHWSVNVSSANKRLLKKMTNRQMRHYKGEIPCGGAYRKMFWTRWDVD